ncbi:MAG: hypothetical protein IKD76_01060 [Clostridia bacterium]|nr:hypothetical protein [Clostridia bacterium]
MGKITAKKQLFIVVGLILATIITSIILSVGRKSSNSSSYTLNAKTAQDKVSITYQPVTDDSVREVNNQTGEQGDVCEFVEFNAFFTQDSNNDGVAERVNGACRSITDTAEVYFRFTVLSKGYLKDGKIKINGENFKLDTAIPMDSVVPKTYIESDTKQIDLAEQVPNGTQKLLVSKITPRISNVNDYSKDTNTVVFEGTYVYENEQGHEVEVELKKTCNLTVDWYGELDTRIVTQEALTLSNEDIYNEESNTVDLSFAVKVRENNNFDLKGLILDSNVLQVKAPNVKGYSAIDARATNDGVESSFNKETGLLTITKKSEVDSAGNVIRELPYTNEYSIVLTYPAEVYNNNDKESLVVTVPVESYYTGYNNRRSEFENEIAVNIAKSNVAKKQLALTYDNPEGDVYNFRTTIGEYVTSPSERYLVSKKETIKAYNHDESENQDLYEVRWMFMRGSAGTISKAEMGYTMPEKLNNDNFNDYTTNIGIYFEGAQAMLGANGYIKVFDADKTGNDALLHTFTADDWGTYTKENPYLYENAVKNVRVEVSESSRRTTLIVHHIKEIDNERLSSEYARETFDERDLIYTFLTGKVYFDNTDEEMTRTGVAHYEDEVSVARISIKKAKIPVTETVEDVNIAITAMSGFNRAKWQNGEFVVELPEGIEKLEINDVTSDSDSTVIKGYNVQKKDGIYIIRIITGNSEAVDSVGINIKCSITADATLPTTIDRINLYAYNENYNNYETPEEDKYDANSNGKKDDKVGFDSTEVQLVAPTALVTYQTLTDYDDSQEDEITMAPNVAEIKKEQRSAQVNIDVLNNYSSTVDKAKILGKIPYQGNTYVITDGDLGSTFTTTLTSKVELRIAQLYKQDIDSERLEELKSNIKIYYSKNEKPTTDLNLESNGWVAEENVTDLSEMKTYLIDFNNYEINIGEDIGFKYSIAVPEGLEYEDVSYAQHAVYFELNTPDGILQDYTEPNKLGIRVTRKYSLNLNKTVLGKGSGIENALYLLEAGKKSDGTYESYIELTNGEGNISLNNLYVEKEYTLRELKCEDEYEISDGSLKFKVVENEETKQLEMQIISEGAGYKSSAIGNHDNVNIDVQDKVRYDLSIVKFRAGTDVRVANTEYVISGGSEETNDLEEYKRRTDENGRLVIDNLHLDKEYTIQETRANENFSIATGVLKFKVVQSERDGSLSVEVLTEGAGYRVYTVDDISEAIEIELENDVKYALKLNKKDSSNGENLAGIEYNVTGALVDTNVLTDSEGNLEVAGLKVGERYTVKEVTAKGYYLNDSFDVVVTRNNDGSLSSNVGTVTDNIVPAELQVNITNDKIATYNLDLIKVEKGNENKKLENVVFTIKGKDLNERLTTDENGKISLTDLYQYVEGKGEYGIYEIQEEIPAQGYLLSSEVLKIKVLKDGNALKVETLEGEDLIADTATGRNIVVNGNTVTITLQNTPMFKIKKVEQGSENPIPNTKFAIYKVTYDENNNESVEPAKDYKGDIIGEEETIAGTVYYVVTTDENGEISADLSAGLYCIEEIESAEGYILPEKDSDRKHYFGIGESKPGGAITFKKVADNRIASYMGENIAVKEGSDGYYTIGIAYADAEVTLKDGNTKAIQANQYYLIKYDSEANIVWCIITNNSLYDIQITEDDKIILMGFDNQLYFEQYDKNGNVIGSRGTMVYARKAASFSTMNNFIRSERGFYVRGSVGSVSTDYDQGDNDIIEKVVTQDQGEKIINYNVDFIAEYDNNFNLLAYYDSTDEQYSQLNQNADKEILREIGSVQTGFFEGEMQVVTKQQGTITVKNATVLAYDENGVEDWAYSFENSNVNIGLGVKTADGGVVAMGNLMNDEVLVIDGKEYNLHAGGIFVKFDENGRVQGISDGFEFAVYISLIKSNMLACSDGKIIYSGETADQTAMQYPAYFEIVEYDRSTPEFAEMQEITVENKRLEYKITTEVLPNSENLRTGGNITGDTVNGEYIKYVERVAHGNDSTVNINVVASEKYKVDSIIIDGVKQNLENGNYKNYTLDIFTNVTSDHHIQVIFEKLDEVDNNFVLTKKDRSGNVLAGAKFTIKKITSDETDIEETWAVDKNGNPVGNLENINGEEVYVLISDQNGEIRASLPEGKYRVKEIQAPNGYVITDSVGKEFVVSSRLEYKYNAEIAQWLYRDMSGDITSDGGNIASVDNASTITKRNVNNDVEWSTKLLKSGNLMLKTVDETQDGNYIVLAEAMNNATINAEKILNATEDYVISSGNYSEVVAIKMDSNGRVIAINKVFNNTSQISKNENVEAVQVLDDGSYVVFCSSESKKFNISAEDSEDGIEKSITGKGYCMVHYTESGKVIRIIGLNEVPMLRNIIYTNDAYYISTKSKEIIKCDFEGNTSNVEVIPLGANSADIDNIGHQIYAGSFSSNINISGDSTVDGNEINIEHPTPWPTPFVMERDITGKIEKILIMNAENAAYFVNAIKLDNGDYLAVGNMYQGDVVVAENEKDENYKYTQISDGNGIIVLFSENGKIKEVIQGSFRSIDIIKHKNYVGIGTESSRFLYGIWDWKQHRT